ncbi:hypothetical protein ACFL2U_02295 [Patescibacteria group bacterium]
MCSQMKVATRYNKWAEDTNPSNIYLKIYGGENTFGFEKLSSKDKARKKKEDNEIAIANAVRANNGVVSKWNVYDGMSVFREGLKKVFVGTLFQQLIGIGFRVTDIHCFYAWNKVTQYYDGKHVVQITFSINLLERALELSPELRHIIMEERFNKCFVYANPVIDKNDNVVGRSDTIHLAGYNAPRTTRTRRSRIASKNLVICPKRNLYRTDNVWFNNKIKKWEIIPLDDNA